MLKTITVENNIVSNEARGKLTLASSKYSMSSENYSKVSQVLEPLEEIEVVNVKFFHCVSLEDLLQIVMVNNNLPQTLDNIGSITVRGLFDTVIIKNQDTTKRIEIALTWC